MDRHINDIDHDHDDHNKTSAPPINSNEVLSSNTMLRNLFHLGYNSKSLSKSIVNTIKFNEVVSTIKSYIENDDLSLKTGGPLLLGLSKVYNKQVKILLDETHMIFKKSSNEESTQEVTKTKRKEKKDKASEESASKSKGTNNSFFGNNMLGLSPLNEGLFSILNKDDKTTPSKFLKSESDLKSPGLFRAINDNSILDSKSKFNLNSNFKNSNGMIHEKSIFEEENQDVNNFFKFISTNDNDFNKQFDNPNAEFDLNFDLPNSNIKQEENKLIFNSETKTLLNLEIANLGIGKEGAFVNLNKVNKKINNKYEYDEYIQQNVDNILESQSVTSEEIMTKYKILTKENAVDYSYLFNMKENIFNFSNKDNDTEAALVANFSRFDVKDFGFAEENYLKDKITKMLEEEEKKNKPIDNFEMFENNFDENQIPEDNKLEELTDTTDSKANLSSFCSKVQSIINKEKKKEINFHKLIKKMDSNGNSSQNFYNLLCIAQNEDIKISQKEIFNNGAMIISLN